MKQINRILLGFLAICLFLSMLPMQSFATETYKEPINLKTVDAIVEATKLEHGENEKSEETIISETISREIATQSFSSESVILDSGFCGEDVTWTLSDDGTLTISGSGRMHDIIFGETSVPWQDYADSIIKVIIEDGVTHIGSYSFAFLNNLTSVSMANDVITIGDNVLYSCQNLEEIILSNSLSAISDYAFSYCSKLSIINIPESVKSIGGRAFYLCESLSQIIGMEGVTIIDEAAFGACYSLSSIILSNSVKTINKWAFEECINLETITIPSSVAYIGNLAFNYCISLSEITFKGTAPTIALNAFSQVKASAYYPADDDTWKNVIIMDYSAATIKWIPTNYYIASGNLGDNVIWKLEDSGVLTVSGLGNMQDYSYYGYSWGLYGDSIKSLIIEDGVTSIGNWTFSKLTNLTNVTIPNSVTSIGENAFMYCENLTNIKIGKGVDTIGSGVFSQCSSLTNVYIADLTAWLQISFNGSSSNPLSAGENLYLNGELLTNIIIPNHITRINKYAFMGYGNLTSVTIPASVTAIDYGAFWGCKGLTKITIPNSVMCIGADAFYNCPGLTSIIIPDSVTEIGNFAFSECTGLKNVTLSSSLTQIAPGLFYGCDNLANITIPESISIIGDNTFEECPPLKNIYFGGTSSQWSSINNRPSANYIHYSCTNPDEHWISKNVYAACETDGYSYEYCSCGFERNKTTVSAVGHTGGTATCKDKAICTCCEKAYGELDVSNHAGGTEIWNASEASCLTQGYTGDVHCADCGEKLTTGETIAAKGHDNVDQVMNPTCTSSGYTIHTCINCNNVFADNFVNPKGHDYKAVITAPTCTEKGYTTHTCACGDTYKDAYKDALGHSMGAWTQTKAPTCTEKGIERRDCANCDHYETRDVEAKGHSYTDTVTAPTCTEKGYTTHTCACGDTYQDSYKDALGHSYQDEWDASCENCGAIREVAPEAPEVKVSGVSSTGKNKLSWAKVEGAKVYKVYRASTANGNYSCVLTTTKLSYTHTSGKAGSRYYYYVVAVDAEGRESRQSNLVNRTCDLSAPKISTSGISSTGKIKVSWEKVEGAKEYKVYRATSKTGTYKLMKTTTSTSYTNTSVEAGKTYYYKVKAIHKNSAADSAYSEVKSRTCDLAAPKVTLSGVASSGKIKVSWKPVEGAKEYKVYRATSKTGTYKLMKTTTSTSYTNTSVEAGKTYYYKVKAIHKNSAADSAYSEVKSRTCDLARPVVSIKLSSKGKPSLNWKKIADAEEYKIYRATSEDGKYSLVKTTTSTSYTNTSAVKGKTYYYKVKAIHSNGNANSAYSLIDSIKSK